MQEVFEKIIRRIEVAVKSSDNSNFTNGLLSAQDIIKQEAEECKTGHFGCNSNGQHEKCSSCCDYDCNNRNREWFGAKDDNNGWISCSERLPEDKQTCLVTARIYHVDEIDNYIGVGIDTYSKQFGWIGTEAIAWQPLPAPYPTEGE